MAATSSARRRGGWRPGSATTSSASASASSPGSRGCSGPRGRGLAGRGAAAALLRAGAALVPRPARSRDARPTTSRRRCACSAALDVPALGGSLDEIVRRHAALRTTFAAAAGRPVADRRARSRGSALPVVDLSALPAAARERDGPRRRRGRGGGAAVRPRRAARCCGPCWLRLGAEEHVAAPHRSTTSSATAGRSGCWCARWRRSTPPSSAGGRRRCRSCRSSTPTSPAGSGGGWQGRGAGARSSPTGASGSPACRSLRAPDRPAAPGASRATAASTRGFVLSPELSAALRALGRDAGATLFMAAAGRLPGPARAATPARRTSPSARPSPAATAARPRPLIGFFVNTLVLRADLAGRPGFADAAGAGRARRPWPPTPTRTCRSRGWSRSCAPRAQPEPPAAVPGDARPPERRRRRRWSCRA